MKQINRNKESKFVTIIILGVILLVVGFVWLTFSQGNIKENDSNKTSVLENKDSKEGFRKSKNREINLISSIEDEVIDNVAWCVTSNLAWEDFKEGFVDDKLEFEPGSEEIDNLNRFYPRDPEEYLSNVDYYIKSGHPNSDFINGIENDLVNILNITPSRKLKTFIEPKYAQKSILIYSMMCKNFEFKYPFNQLGTGYFYGIDGRYNNVKYYGVEENTSDKIKNQIKVLYYNNEDEYAILLNTKENLVGEDIILNQIILAKGLIGGTFHNRYSEIEYNTKLNKEGRDLLSNDYVKIPNFDFNIEKNMPNLEQQSFLTKNIEVCTIENVLQNIDLTFDATNHKKIFYDESSNNEKNYGGRNFKFDSNFDIYIKESDKELPYFAAKISDPTIIQSGDIKVK